MRQKTLCEAVTVVGCVGERSPHIVAATTRIAPLRHANVIINEPLKAPAFAIVFPTIAILPAFRYYYCCHATVSPSARGRQ